MTLFITWLSRFLFIKFVAMLGVGTLTFYGYRTLVDELTQRVYDSYAGLPVDVLNLLALSGITTSLGIVLAALVIRATFVFSPKLGVVNALTGGS